MQVTKHICPCNCMDNCGMLAFVNERGLLVKVEGDPDHPYTKGKLCSKGYAYLQYVYNPQRLLYPMVQYPRFSGNWQRISWDDALKMLSEKIVDLKNIYGSFLPIAFLKGTGNLGGLSEAVRGLFASLGPITAVTGSLCLSAGWDAQLLDFGGVRYRNPEEMLNANLLILWGNNPAATAIHTMPLIQRIHERGGKVILIDVLPTATFKYADEYIQVRPGSDGALALAVLRQLLVNGWIDQEFVTLQAEGWGMFNNWLRQANPTQLAQVSGVKQDVIDRLASDIAKYQTTAFWPGFGLQRYSNGGQNMRAIDALAAASGNLTRPGGGVYWPNIDFCGLNYRVLSSSLNLKLQENRQAGISSLGRNLASFDDPPVKLLWVTCSNPLARGSDLSALRSFIHSSDLMVTVDHFMTTTAQASDLVLPATTCFESPDLVIGSWHNFVGVTQQAIKPMGESRSELGIACSLSQALNTLEPGISSFPTDLTEETWLQSNISSWLKQNLGLNSYRSLLKKPYRLIKPLQFPPYESHESQPSDQVSEHWFKFSQVQELLSGKYQFSSPLASDLGCPEIPVLVTPLSPPLAYPYRLLVLHPVESLNTQFTNLDWLAEDGRKEQVWLSPTTARSKGISSSDRIMLYNSQGEIYFEAKIKPWLSDELIISYSWRDLHGKAVNTLMSDQVADLGECMTKFPGIAYHDTFVNLTRS